MAWAATFKRLRCASSIAAASSRTERRYVAAPILAGSVVFVGYSLINQG